MARKNLPAAHRDFRWYCLMSSPFIAAALASQGLDAQTTIPVTDMAGLRGAINTANANSGNYIITLAAGTYSISGNGDNTNASGDLDITKSAGTLEIVGTGAANVIIDGQALDRVFHINNGANAPVTIRDLAITNGRATDNGSATTEARGGGILKEGAGALTLNGVRVGSNIARGANGANGANGINGAGQAGTAGRSAFGGGVYVAAGTVSLASCTITQNAANGGNGGNGGWGGVGSFTTFGLAFTAYNGGNGAGGAAGGGGGIFIGAGTLTLDTCIIDQNTTQGGNGGHGGLAGGPAWQPANGGTAGGAGASSSAGVFVEGGTLNMADTTITGCIATGGTGGNGGSANIALTAQGVGRAGAVGGAAVAGGLLNVGDATIERCTISGNEARGGTGGNGGQGGMSIYYGASGLPGGEGGLARGGGVYTGVGTTTIVNSTISGNTARAGNGGNGGMGGECASAASGGVRPGDGGTGGNGGSAQGAGIYFLAGTLAVDNCTTAFNTATAGTGGSGGFPGIGGSQNANSGGAGNSGQSQGGGIYVGNTTLTMASSLFSDNVAGTGTDYYGNASASLSNCLLEANPAGTSVPVTGFITGDPALSALANNGGPTNTHAISGTSIARNTGSNPRALATDQRGNARNDGNGVDIGSFEDGSTPPVGQTQPPVVSAPAAPVTLNAANYDIQGTAPAGSLVRIYSDANDNGVVDGADAVVNSQQLGGAATGFSITVALTQNAANNFLATADDATNIESNPVNVPTITEDSLPPALPVVTAPASAVSVSGTTYTIQGTAEAGSLVQVYRDFNNNGVIDSGSDVVVSSQQLTTGNSNFSILTGITVSTANDFLVTATDGAANESAPADVPTITENTPAAINPPVVTNPATPITVDLPAFNIQGTAQANALVRIYSDLNNDGFVNGTDTMVASEQLTGGNTSFAVSTTLAQGAANNFLATAFDGANESLPTDVPTITDSIGLSQGGGSGSGGGGGGGCATRTGTGWGLLALLALPIAWLRRRARA